jgi:alpha-L-fucosidase
MLLLVSALSLHAQTYQQRIDQSLRQVDRIAAKGPFRPSWKSLERFKTPAWYQDAKFGIFIHWGVYSVPAFGDEWYPRNMYLLGDAAFQHHVTRYGSQAKFGYKDFIPQFKAEKFNPDEWADLFRKSGAKYVVPVAEHHDGFAMYDSALSDWTAVKMAPKRDVIGELAAAVRKQGLHFGASSHRAEHWWFYEGGMQFDSDVKDPNNAAFYGPAQPQKKQPDQAFLDDWLARSAEIVDKYQPELMWFDWWIEQPVFEPYLQRFAAYYYNRGAQWKRGVAINYKNKSFPEHAAVLDIERGRVADLRPLFWQSDTSVSRWSWGYIMRDQFKSTASIITDLVDIVSKNGTLLLNIGPRADGTIPDEARKILTEIGGWLGTNGEAIYGTRPWRIYGEGPTKVEAGSFKDSSGRQFTADDIRFTRKGSTLYAIAMGWPASGRIVLKSLANQPVKKVELLGAPAALRWSRTAEGLTIDLPEAKLSDFAIAFKISPIR